MAFKTKQIIKQFFCGFIEWVVKVSDSIKIKWRELFGNRQYNTEQLYKILNKIPYFKQASNKFDIAHSLWPWQKFAKRDWEKNEKRPKNIPTTLIGLAVKVGSPFAAWHCLPFPMLECAVSRSLQLLHLACKGRTSGLLATIQHKETKNYVLPLPMFFHDNFTLSCAF